MYIKHTPNKVAIKGYKDNDCTVIAIGNALGISYDLSRKILQTVYSRRVTKHGELPFRTENPLAKEHFILQMHVQKVCRGLSVEEIKFEPFEREKRITLRKFAKDYNEGIYLALVDRHLATVIDGQLIDTFDSSSRKMIAAYKIDLPFAHETIKGLAKYYKMDNKKHIFQDHKENMDYYIENRPMPIFCA